MAYALVDFDTHTGRDFEQVKPIGIWLTKPEGGKPDGGIDLLYFEAVTDGTEAGFENYMVTFRQMEQALIPYRNGEVFPDFARWLEYVSGTTYLGHTYRTFGEVPDGMTIEEAFEMYVVREEPLPVSEVVVDVG